MQKINDYLKNSNNVVLTELNVGFLNNEGTTFIYNENNNNLAFKDLINPPRFNNFSQIKGEIILFFW